MLPIERQQTMMEWLKHAQTLRITDISERFKVSEMTVYRDIQQLIDNGEVSKTPGGITLLKKNDMQPIHTCVYCFKVSKSKFSIQLISDNHEVQHACCAHCAVLYTYKNEEITSMLCADFLIETTLNMKQAFFLVNTDVSAYCCYPQVLTFTRKQDAEKFQLGFNGEIHTYTTLQSFLLHEMKAGCTHDV